MNRRSLPIATALTATAVLVLTACGSGGGKTEANDKIAGVDKGETKPTTPSSSPIAPPGRPEITLPSDVKDVFEGWKIGDATKDAILNDAAQAQSATNYAITQGDVDEPALAFYRQGDALISGMKWVQSFVDDGISYTGTVRYFKPEISVFDEKSAGLVFCADESGAHNKDRKTGKVDKTPPSDKSFLLYSTRLEKNAQGVWQTTKLVSQRGHKTCTL
ncbi:hypothetical protein ACFWOJ_21790 [Streptomyces sp. NPDC058439]|uniref:hypothetical protein n=1 Tax=Streptomyces sp. NPDC058439 TaxID=3346500 RepID=UPI00364AFD11